MAWKQNQGWPNGKSYLGQDEMFADEYQHIINKLSEVIFMDTYFEDTKIFCRSVLDFAIDHEYITWKQANAILNIKTTEERRQLYHRPTKYKTSPYIYGKHNLTDRQHDRFVESLFGNSITSDEMEGYEKQYRRDGSRYFALPDTNKQLHEYL